jgi:hypothetical protein
VAVAVCGAEVCMLEGIAELVFVFFSYVEDEWPQTCVFVGAVLFPCCCSSDSDNDAGLGFADFYS